MKAPARTPGIVAAAALVSAVALAAGTPAPAAAAEIRYGTGVPRGLFVDTVELDRQYQGGVRVARAGLKWNAVQPRRGAAYDWSLYDKYVAKLTRAGIAFLPILIGSPPYAAQREAHPPTTRAGKRGFDRFVHAAVRRYGRDGSFWNARRGRALPYRPITAWEVWNEPNIGAFWTDGDPNVREYAELLRGAHGAIKSADPRATVVLAGMPEIFSGPRQIPMSGYLDQLYELPGMRRRFDVVASHPYAETAQGVGRYLRRVRAVMRSHGDARKPLWITEVGWASAGPSGHPLVKGEAEQGRLLRGTFRMLDRRSERFRLGTVLWYRWRDPVPASAAKGAGGTWQQGAGLFTDDGDPKSAWRAFAGAAGGSAGLGPLPNVDPVVGILPGGREGRRQ